MVKRNGSTGQSNRMALNFIRHGSSLIEPYPICGGRVVYYLNASRSSRSEPQKRRAGISAEVVTIRPGTVSRDASQLGRISVCQLQATVYNHPGDGVQSCRQRDGDLFGVL